MSTNALSALEFDAQTTKRAQWEAFEFDLDAPGIVTVRNGSHADPDDHEYRVNVEGGVPVACECPADEYQPGACKHRVAIAIREPVLAAASGHDEHSSPSPDRGLATDGGEHLSATDGQTPDAVENTCSFGNDACDGADGDGLPCFDCYLSTHLDHYPADAVAVPAVPGDDETETEGEGENDASANADGESEEAA